MHKIDSKGVWSFLLFYMALGGWTPSMRGPGRWICGHGERSVPENTCAQVADFALQTVLKVVVDFLPNARAGHLIKSSFFFFFFFAKLSSIKNISLTNITLKFFKKHIFEELEVTFYFIHIPPPSSISSWAEQFNFQSQFGLESQLFLFHPELPSWIQDPSSFELWTPCFQGHPILINLH